MDRHNVNRAKNKRPLKANNHTLEKLEQVRTKLNYSFTLYGLRCLILYCFLQQV